MSLAPLFHTHVLILTSVDSPPFPQRNAKFASPFAAVDKRKMWKHTRRLTKGFDPSFSYLVNNWEDFHVNPDEFLILEV